MNFVNPADGINYLHNVLINSKCTIQFSELRSNLEVVGKIREEISATGLNLRNQELLEKLKNSEYVPILKALWPETNKARLEWLRSHAGNHAPLMYELAIEEFVATPNIDTLREISFPLIQAASQRVGQDASCLKIDDRPTFQRLIHKMNEVYRTALLDAVKTYTDSLVPMISKIESLARIRSERRIETALNAVDTPGFPNPKWVSCDFQYTIGMNEESKTQFVNVEEQLLPMHNEQTWTSRRKVFAQRLLERLNIQPQRLLERLNIQHS